MGAYRYRAELLDVEPPCVRTILVPDRFNFRDLAYTLNAAFDWWEGHEHIFGVVIDPEKDDVLDVTDYGDEIGLDVYETEDALLREYPGKTIQYTYDMGDEWRHLVTFEGKVEDYDLPYPSLESYEGRAPPEDCGGPCGYGELLVKLSDPDDPEHYDMMDWAEWIGFEDPVPGDIDYELSKIDGSGEPEYDEHLYWKDGPELLPGYPFWDDMDRYRGVDPGRTIPFSCEEPWPTYRNLSPEQLDWYLSWRSACDRGDVKETAKGYLWLYLAELADRDDWKSAVETMKTLYDAFQHQEEKSLIWWTASEIKDAHRPENPEPDTSERFDWYDAERYLSKDPLPELPRKESEAYFRVNEKYCWYGEEETIEMIGYALSAMNAYCRNAHGKDILDALYGPGWVKYYPWLPSRRQRSFQRRTKGCWAIDSISTCAVARRWRIDHPRGGPQVRPALDKEFIGVIDGAVKDFVAGKPFDPENYG